MQDFDEKKSKIESVNEALYSKNAGGIFVKKRHALSNMGEINKPQSDWKEEPVGGGFKIPYLKILLGAFIFFILAIGFAFFKFFAGSNTVSGNNIDILVSGPVSVSGGEEFPLDIKIINRNNIDLKTVDLRIEYPEGTRDPKDTSVVLTRYSEVLGDINVGKSSERLIKAVLFGEESSQKIIKIKVEYRILGSNAVFDKEKDYNVIISSSPVNISVAGDSEINANQETNFTINITSNSLSTLKGLILKVDYPFGFNFISSNPNATSYDNSVFNLGDLEPRAKRTVTLSGTITGQDGEERVLKFTVGTPDPSNKTTVKTPLALYAQTVSLKKPFMGLDVSINQNNASEVPIDVGGKVKVDINWQNNLPDKLYNIAFNVKFTGDTLDRQSVSVSKGFYNSSNNTIIFDRNNNTDLDTVNPSDQGNLGFEFASLNPLLNPSVSFGNSKIIMTISISGSGVGGNSSGQVLYSGQKILNISSNLDLLSRGFRTVGPFENSGPFPPKVDQETTYTIVWTATDSFNNINNAKVSAILPANVKWTGFTSPGTENITYDQSSGQVVWNIGNMPSNTGTTNSPREVSFQVAITPSVTQAGTEIVLLNEATISGKDAFSGGDIGEVKPAITTNVTSDPNYIPDIGKVRQ